MLGVLLALASSLSFSLNGVMARRGRARSAASAGAFITVLMGVPLFMIAALVSGQMLNAGDVSLNGYVLLSLAGIAHFGIGRYFNYRAASAIGATRAAPMQALTVPYAIGIAWLFLDEPVTPMMGVGILLILVGPSIMVQRRGKPRPDAASNRMAPRGGSTEAAQGTFQLRQVEGYLSALMTVFCYGTSPILIRAAIGGIEGVSIFGGMVAYIAAALALIATLAIPTRRGLIQAMNFSTIRLFLSAGVFAFLAQMFRFMALAIAPVAVVTPLQRTAAMFTLVLSYAVNRHLELINLRVVLGIVFSVSGAVLLAVYS